MADSATLSYRDRLPQPLARSEVHARPNSPELDAILGLRFPVLDKGWVAAVDYMGNERTPAHTARTSTKGQDAEQDRSLKADLALLTHLTKGKHTSPFEGASIRFVIKLPLFVARQWMRHRTGKFNEMSGRYSTFDMEFYTPEAYYQQDAKNKQMRDSSLTVDGYESLIDETIKHSESGKALYEKKISEGVAREMARDHMSLNAYTVMSFKMDLLNLLKFLVLRTALDAQPEIREYAIRIEQILYVWVPHIMEMYAEYMRDTVTLSASEAREVRELLGEIRNKDEIANKLQERIIKRVGEFRS